MGFGIGWSAINIPQNLAVGDPFLTQMLTWKTIYSREKEDSLKKFSY